MQNFILISPHFPETYYRFAEALKQNGFRVLGIGDCPYDNLREELKNDRAKTQVEGFTKLNLMEMTRKHICSHLDD